jgi:DNA repair protein RecN (Recombination protein N)
MLIELSIRDVVLIERLDLKFAPAKKTGGKNSGALAALTGETGAGKSILLDALGLALGSRGDSGLVRHGAAQSTVSAAFEVAGKHPALALLQEQGLDSADGMLVLRRVLASDGRGRAFINDQPVSVGLLRQVGDLLVEVQGQFEQHGLLNPARHREVLDEFSGLDEAAQKLAAHYHAWRQAEAAHDKAQQSLSAARAEQDYLRHAVDELSRLDPGANEEAELADERQLLRHGAALAEALAAAGHELDAGKGVAGALRAAQRLLERNSDKAAGRFDQALAALDRAAVEAAEAQAQVEELQRTLNADPGRLEKVEERLYALRAAARKYAVEIAGLAGLRAQLEEQLAAIDGGGQHLKKLRQAADEARGVYVAAAEKMSAARKKAATAMDKAVATELAPLKLEKARFITQLDGLPESDWNESGMDRVAFLVSTNPGTPPGPLNKIASGGELSRFMLALKVVLARTGKVGTLVFDEVDSGVGGATAAAVGERLAKLATDRQVLVVTHSPQVAARADLHWRIGKRTSKGSAVTEVAVLDAEGRKEEIARMLAGSEITAEARAAAARLMASAG